MAVQLTSPVPASPPRTPGPCRPCRPVAAFTAPITLPMSPGPAGAQLGDDGRHVGGDFVGATGAAAGRPRAPAARRFPCRPGRCARPAANCVIESLRCLISLSTMPMTAASSSTMRSSTSFCLHGREQPRMVSRRWRVLGAHGGLHVFGDAVFEAHGSGLAGAAMNKARSGVPRGLRFG